MTTQTSSALLAALEGLYALYFEGPELQDYLLWQGQYKQAWANARAAIDGHKATRHERADGPVLGYARRTDMLACSRCGNPDETHTCPEGA